MATDPHTALSADEALAAINALRCNVVATQSAGWSNLMYPLVAILNAAGYSYAAPTAEQTAEHLTAYGGAGGWPGPAATPRPPQEPTGPDPRLVNVMEKGRVPRDPDSPRWWHRIRSSLSDAAVSREVERIRDLEAALTQAIEVIEWCGLNDKTPPYRYGSPRPNGDLPGAGKTFNTPREFAGWWPDRLREALRADA